MEKTLKDGQQKEVGKGEKLFRYILFGICELFCLVSVLLFFVKGEPARAVASLGTMCLVAAPVLLSKLFRLGINTVFFAFCELYALGPMLGHAYKLYYYTPWWDDLLHTSGGVVFAVLGLYLAKLIGGKQESNLLTKALFALFFSMAISVLWEFIEYGLDTFFRMDMQSDSWVSFINSYLIGDATGVIGSMNGITEVIVDGVSLGGNGYLDIGLHDTMHDMLVETLGALAFFVVYLVDKERHPLLWTKPKKEKM